jgi:hypothetical protein
VLESTQHLRLYGVETSTGSACALLPMCYPRTRSTTRILSATSNFYTPLFQILLAPGCNMEQIIPQLASTIYLEKPSWESIHLFPLQQDEITLNIIRRAFLRNGILAESYQSTVNWHLRTDGCNYETYFKNLPSKLRNTLSRKQRKLNQLHSASFCIFKDSNRIEQAIVEYQSVYRHSWKSAEAYPAFIPALIRLCAENRSLRLGIAYINQQAVAAQLWIVHGGIASIYKLAYQTEFSKLSIGSLLTAHLMQHVIDIDQVSEVDFLTGDDAYKSEWMPLRRHRCGLMLFNLRTFSGFLGACKYLGKTSFKNGVNKLR